MRGYTGILFSAFRLSGVRDPERKRKIIGEAFIDVFEKEAKKLGQFDFLAQGTLYPDVIESVSFKGPSVTIKSHHTPVVKFNPSKFLFLVKNELLLLLLLYQVSSSSEMQLVT